MYYLTRFDDVISSGFWVILKITFANLCKPNYDIHYSTSICPFESRKCGKEGRKWQKCEHLDNENSFLDEIKYIFHSFWRPIIWWKNEHLIKIADTSLKRQYFIKFNSFQVNKSFLYPLKTSENQRLFIFREYGNAKLVWSGLMTERLGTWLCLRSNLRFS